MVAVTEKFDKLDTNYPKISEALGILLMALSLITLLSLLSYDPLDAAWNVVTMRTQTANWIGSIGAWISDLLFQIFGLSAFLIPVVCTTVGWRLLRLRQPHLLHRKFLGLILILIAVAGLLSLLPMPFYRENVRFGGAIGYLLANFLELQLNKTGTAISLAVMLLFSLMIATNFSINSILESATARSLIQWIVAAEMAVRGHWQNFQLQQKERAEARRRSRIEKAAEREKERQERLAKQRAEQEAKALQKAQAAQAAAKAKATKNLPATPVNEVVPNTDEVVRPAAIASARLVKPVQSAPLVTPPTMTGPVIPPPVSEPVVQQYVKSPYANNTNVEELRRLVYGEDEIQAPIEEFSLSGAVPPLEIKKAMSAAVENHNPRRRSDTVKVPSPPPAEVLRNAHPSISSMLASAAIARNSDEESGDFAPMPPPPSSLYNDFVVPPMRLLTAPPPAKEQDDDELWDRAKLLAEKCQEFSVSGKIQYINPGPVVTTFEFKPDPGVKYSRVTGLVDDLCLALKAESIRIDRIPGKSTVGIEVPNITRETIFLREICESEKYVNAISPLVLALGKTIDGKTYVADLAKMPHLLIAGATGTGKSVCLNSLIVSILCKASPDQVKMIMVDPKRLELGLYEGIPHLLTPIVLEPKRASNALKWAVGEMENRYKMLAGHGVRNIDQYNTLVRQQHEQIPALHPDLLPRPLPYIVIIIDELADLMMVASNDVETSITRLAQMARAVGIHLIIATQRPSVDVITGLIKANFPSRISFRVSSKVDSRTILDTNGAEALLGQGDMLFLPPGTSRLVRVHGAYVNETEIGRIVDHIRQQAQPAYDESIQFTDEEAEAQSGNIGHRDELYDEALRIICQMGRASTSVLQRRLRIGYGRAAAILDMMELEGYVGPSDGSKPRVVKPLAHEYLERLDQIREE